MQHVAGKKAGRSAEDGSLEQKHAGRDGGNAEHQGPFADAGA